LRRLRAVRSVDEARAERAKAGERLLLAWGAAIVPNVLVAFGVEFDGGWMVIRYVLSALFLVMLALWLAAVWRVRRARRSPPGVGRRHPDFRPDG
jgi:hypothetical protein